MGILTKQDISLKLGAQFLALKRELNDELKSFQKMSSEFRFDDTKNSIYTIEEILTQIQDVKGQMEVQNEII
jgi:hypothetical protein